jgi:hypothetical protein
MADPGQIDTPTAIAAIVSPIKAIGALVGFAVGFAATYRSGGAIADSIMHGLLGALLLLPLAWFLALFLVREGIKANVDDQRRQYDARVTQAKRQVAEQMQASGMPVPPALQEALRAPQLPPGRG